MLTVWLARYFKARQGNFSIMVSLLGVALIGFCGLAYDVTNVMRVKQQLNASADTAALSAVKAQAAKDPSAKELGETYFKSNAKMIDKVSVNSVNVEFDNKGGSRKVTANVNYEATVRPSFMGAFGFKTVPVRGAVKATMERLQRVHLSILIDNSASMGVGATLKDQKIMFDTKGCALACHHKSEWEPKTSLEIVREAGAKVRIDITRAAVENMLKELQTSMGGTSNLDVSVYSFSNELEHVYGPGTNISQARKAVSGVDLTREPYTGGTNIAYSMEKFIDNLKSSQQKNSDSTFITVIVTDGVVNSRTEFRDADGKNSIGLDKNAVISDDAVFLNADTAIEPPLPGFCDGLKEMGNIVYVINTDYITDSPYTKSSASFAKVDKMLPKVDASLRECAGEDSHYVNAGSPDEIFEAAQKVLSEISNEIAPRLSH